LEEYYREAKGGELRLELSLENLGQLIDLTEWLRAEFVFTVADLANESQVSGLTILRNTLFRVSGEQIDPFEVLIDIQQVSAI
jgi:hypothetical protein